MPQTATIEAPTRTPTIAALFNLDDPSERFIVEVIQRFHGEDRIWRAHAMRRSTNSKGDRVVVELASHRPGERSPKWEVIHWNPDEVSVRFHPCRDRQQAEALYHTEPLMSPASLRGVTMPKPKSEKPTPSKPPIDPDMSMPKAEFDRVVSEILKVPPERVKEGEGKTPKTTPKTGKGKS